MAENSSRKPCKTEKRCDRKKDGPPIIFVVGKVDVDETACLIVVGWFVGMILGLFWQPFPISTVSAENMGWNVAILATIFAVALPLVVYLIERYFESRER